MKKIMMTMVAAAVMLSVSLDADAQFSRRDNNRVPDRFHMGLRAGVTGSTLTGDHTDGMKDFYFPYGGLALDFQVAPVPIFVESGLYYMNRGWKYEEEYQGHSYSYKYDEAHSVLMPLVASYHLNIGQNLFLQPFFGLFAAYNLDKIDDDYDDWQDERFDWGLRFGLGFNFGRLYANLGYDLGLKNLSGDDKHSIKSGVMFATLGFNFAGSR